MPFVYNSILIRPNTSIPWFRDANPAAYGSIVEAVQSAPGYLSGSWEQDPAYPNRFLITHTWTDKASWKAMSDGLKSLSSTELNNVYRITNNIYVTVITSE